LAGSLVVLTGASGGGKTAIALAVEALHPEATKPDTYRIYTDDKPGYIGIAKEDTTHEGANHSAEEWVRGDASTNGIEGAWSQFKRSLVGSYHQVSKKHIERYVEEFEFRFNNSDNPSLFRDTLTRLVMTEKMEYKELIA
jgi:transposase-like protein